MQEAGKSDQKSIYVVNVFDQSSDVIRDSRGHLAKSITHPHIRIAPDNFGWG